MNLQSAVMNKCVSRKVALMLITNQLEKIYHELKEKDLFKCTVYGGENLWNSSLHKTVCMKCPYNIIMNFHATNFGSNLRDKVLNAGHA